MSVWLLVLLASLAGLFVGALLVVGVGLWVQRVEAREKRRWDERT